VVLIVLISSILVDMLFVFESTFDWFIEILVVFALIEFSFIEMSES